MKKISIKIGLTILLLMAISTFIPSALYRLFEIEIQRPEQSPIKMIIIGGFITVVVPLFLIYVVIDRMVLTRVRILNKATEDIISGNFDVDLEVKDKDELSDLMNNFNEMAKDLKSNEYLNKEFVRNFSHELKTPLSAIKGYADLIKEGDLSEKEQAEYAEIIATESNRLSELSRSMLMISLVDSSSIVKKDNRFNVTEQVRNVLQISQIEWEKKRIELELEMEEVSISSNKELTYHIWQNLFTNAVRFSKDGDAITIKLFETDDKIIFEIQNPGHIDLDDQEHIFDLFYVVSESRNKKSTGVGLTLTKKIVQKLHGELSFESKDNKIVFKVELPKE